MDAHTEIIFLVAVWQLKTFSSALKQSVGAAKAVEEIRPQIDADEH